MVFINEKPLFDLIFQNDPKWAQNDRYSIIRGPEGLFWSFRPFLRQKTRQIKSNRQ